MCALPFSHSSSELPGCCSCLHFHSLRLSRSSLGPVGISPSVLSGCAATGPGGLPQPLGAVTIHVTGLGPQPLLRFGADSGSIPAPPALERQGWQGQHRPSHARPRARAQPAPSRGCFRLGRMENDPWEGAGAPQRFPLPVVIPSTSAGAGLGEEPTGQAEFSALRCVWRNSSRLCSSPLPSPCFPRS